MDSRGLRDQFDSGQMMGNYSTKIDERAKEIEEMRKLKAEGIKDVWESQPGEFLTDVTGLIQKSLSTNAMN